MKGIDSMPLVLVTCAKPDEPNPYDHDRPMYEDLHEIQCKDTMMQVMLLSKSTSKEMLKVTNLETQTQNVKAYLLKLFKLQTLKV